MKKSYKGHQVDIVSEGGSAGWMAWAKITPPVSAIRTLKALSLSKGGYATREEAENTLWEEAKKRIDEITRGDAAP